MWADGSSSLDENVQSYSDNGQDQAPCGSKVEIGSGAMIMELLYVSYLGVADDRTTQPTRPILTADSSRSVILAPLPMPRIWMLEPYRLI
jgi:hypothetical protein